MRIALVDLATWDYAPDTPLSAPLGGSQSALCYLSAELAQLGHEVHLLNGSTRAGTASGVAYGPLSGAADAGLLGRCDAVVLQNTVQPAARIRPLLGSRTRLVLWTQHAHDQPAVEPLRSAEVRRLFDAFALVSTWQEQCYLAEFALEPERCRVLRNAAGPAFAGLFANASQAARAKSWPPVLAYTSTPFRGLDLLLDIFPAVRQAIPGTELKVYSSMQVYRLSAADDTARYGALYRRCLEIDGVEYVGSLPQPDLAAALSSATLLAYPNHFAETSCIAVMEALAAGLRVVTSDLAALPETAAGLAALVAVDGDWAAYRERFAREVIRVLEHVRAHPDESQAHLARQLALVEQEYNWPRRAREWDEWLSALCR